jgi:hypothetical protein
MEDMDNAAVTEWLRSMKLDNAADICSTHEIDGFVFMALLEEEGGLDSIGIKNAFDRAKVRDGVRKRMRSVESSNIVLTQRMTPEVDNPTIAIQPDFSESNNMRPTPKSTEDIFCGDVSSISSDGSVSDTAPSNTTTTPNTTLQLPPFMFQKEFLSWTDVTVAVHTMALRANKQVHRTSTQA